MPKAEELTPRQQQWMAAVRASLERDSGKTLDEWVAIARTCPETRPRKRVEWMRDHHGLGQNRAMHVLTIAFPETANEDSDALRAALWANPAAAAVLVAVEAAVAGLPDLISGQRKGFTAWSREFQFAALKPMRGGSAILGLAVEPDASARLAPPRNEGWSERLKSKLTLAAPANVDAEIAALLKASWERS
ncbi:MAG TPA: DUF4287 domain-containing protein [Caulobacteraceae bacterium]|jgi:hypothetical protein